ncbi:MAG TPA: hypothetical protein VJ111_11395 [Chitinophagaceae bacterium]|nr:hypothetical protein [Chitinophagaceae bacterium]
MKTYHLDRDIHVFCKTATSFPDGVKEAHESLHRLVSFSAKRKYFGLSWMNKEGDIVYKAAAEELTPGELSKHQLESFTIRSGDYIYTDVKNFMQNIPAIGQAFDQLKSDKRIDPEGVALEWYLNETDVRCMIRLK